jgi:uncharacterized protein (TIGR00369 family)
MLLQVRVYICGAIIKSMYKVQNPNYKQRIKKYLERQEFMKHIGFNLEEIKPGETKGSIDIKQIHKQQKGLLHGGVVTTIADIVAGFSAYTLVPEDYNVVTGEIKVSFLNPGLTDKVYARGWVIKSGRKLNFCESEVWEMYKGEKRILAKASTTMITLYPNDIGSNIIP